MASEPYLFRHCTTTIIGKSILNFNIFIISMLCLGGLSYSEEFNNSHRISAGDKLKIQVYQEEDLGGEFPVNEDGTIAYPLLGSIKVANLTSVQVEKNITESLEKDYLVHPYVHVSVKSGRR